MTPDEVLKIVIAETKEGSYSTTNGITTIRTVTGIAILSCDSETITFYVPMFNEHICEYVTSEKYGDYSIDELTEEQLTRIIKLFETRLKKSETKYRKFLTFKLER